MQTHLLPDNALLRFFLLFWQKNKGTISLFSFFGVAHIVQEKKYKACAVNKTTVCNKGASMQRRTALYTLAALSAGLCHFWLQRT